MLASDRLAPGIRPSAISPTSSLHRPRGARPGAVLLAIALVAVLLAACSGGAPTAFPAASPAASPPPTSAATPAGSPLDLAAIVIPPDSAPPGTTLSDTGGGAATLQQLPVSPGTAASLMAAAGFTDGHWSRFAGSEEDFAASKSFILTWVAQYASPSAAQHVFGILLDELQSGDKYGWGVGEDAGLGDEGTCLEGENPELGGLHETICLWRRGPLVMIVGGGSENATPIPVDAAAMDARATALHP